MTGNFTVNRLQATRCCYAGLANSRPAHRRRSANCRRLVVCASQKEKAGGRDFKLSAQKTEIQTDLQQDCDQVFPEFEQNQVEEYFPHRDPGSFPPIGHKQSAEPAVAGNGAAVGIEKETEQYDPLRDGPLRYLGYANELGEAFASWMPSFGVPLSYAVAIGYVLVDTGDKVNKAYHQVQADLESDQNLPSEVDRGLLVKLLTAERGIDTIVWQLLASVAVPGFTIHQVVALMHYLLESGLGITQEGGLNSVNLALQPGFVSLSGILGVAADLLVQLADKGIPTAAGLVAIPFIVHPIDNSVHALLNQTLRPAMRNLICGPAKGKLAGLDLCKEEICEIK